MFLRSLTLKGFKSFADKTTLEFVPGVSVIVGPNGSGKSNLVDAIAWVLGEQGARSLRGGNMADVIFAGSPKRPGLGMAEVQLVIDNEAGKIPVPLSEIQISRTVFRSGESEYRIGGEVRRLMDIQELLSDSGIGRALHTIVGQGQLDEVLTARPEDRRQFIEEAAGIAKHRRRKDRAERKLISLDQDLLRLQDVSAELRRQLKPLRHQAESAKKHEKLSGEAEELAWRLAAARLRALQTTRDQRRPAWEQGIAARSGAKTTLDALDAQIDELTTRRERATTALAEAETTLRDAQARRTSVAGELESARDAEVAARARLATQAERSARADEFRSDLVRSDAELAGLSEEITAREAELEAAELAFREAQDTRRLAEDERRRAAESAAARRAEIDTLRRSIMTYEREREGLDEQITAIRAAIDASAGERDRLGKVIEDFDAAAFPEKLKAAALVEEHDRLKARVDELDAAVATHRTRAEVLSARRADLAETPGSRLLLVTGGRSAGLLRDLVRPHRGWERALAAALGAAGDAVVYENRGLALADAPEGGGALILSPTPGSTSQTSGEHPDRLLDHVTVDPRAQAAAEAMLGHVVVASSVQAADEEVHSNPSLKAVTQDGVLVGATAIQTASEEASRARELADEHEVVSRELAASESALRPVRRRLSDLATEQADVVNHLAQLDSQRVVAATELAQVESSLIGSRREEELLVQRRSGLDDSAAVWRATLEDAESMPAVGELPALPPLPEPPIAVRVTLESTRRERASLEGRMAQMRFDLDTLLAQTPEQLRAEVDAAAAKLAAVETALRDVTESLTAAESARAAGAEEQRDATASEAEANTAWREAAADLERLRESYEDEDRARGDLERRIGDAERLLAEGHQRNPEEAVAALEDGETVEDLDRRNELVGKRLEMLGRVNLLASGEFEALQERFDFMERELDDVRKARRDLLEVVRRVDEEVVTLFDAAYRDVAQEFERMFQNLFPGGEGRLVLTDPTNLLETGIDIEARPGKKRVKRLSLLSGGERSLTALGFLFSIFRARPSPFYLLDEVEAALDDINLHRFLALIKDFSSHSQVLIVTHQKRTMEAAEMMYGVSMNQDGSTRVLCQTLHDPVPDSAEGVVPETQRVN